MPPVPPEHQSIITRDHAHGRGKGEGSQVRSQCKQVACGSEFSQKQFWDKQTDLALVTCQSWEKMDLPAFGTYPKY